MNFTLESLNECQVSNIKLESNVNTLKSKLSESNTSFRELVVDKSNLHKILGVQIIVKKNYRLSYDNKGTNYTNTLGTSLVSIMANDVRAKVIK